MKNNSFSSVALAILIFFCGVIIGYLFAPGSDDVRSSVADTASNVANVGGDDSNSGGASDGSGVAFTINIEGLSESQKALVRSMGIDGNEIVVTNDMYNCAVAKVGEGRLIEIKNGATPSFSEGASLMACY